MIIIKYSFNQNEKNTHKPATIFIRQGETMGRPSRLTVKIPVTGGIIVTGMAVPIGDD